jgi:hypothetical protein
MPAALPHVSFTTSRPAGRAWRALLGVAWSLSTAVAQAESPPSGGCDVRSGHQRAALVELYTSEGCSSCPPADQQLRQASQWLGPVADVVPLALHVDYWDSIGWKDRFAQASFGRRHQWLVANNGHQTVYTPHFFVNGQESREWRDEVPAMAKRWHAQPPGAELRLKATPAVSGASGQWLVEASAVPTAEWSAKVAGRGATQGLALFVVATEDGLSSHVSRGENLGVTLRHDHVVRFWSGPVPLGVGTMPAQVGVNLPPDALKPHVRLVSFVQDMRDGQVLQALSCSPGQPR